MAERMGEHMTKEFGIKFIRKYQPVKVELIEKGTPGRLRVTAQGDGEDIVEEYNTVYFAIGREPQTRGLGLEKVGVKINPKNDKIITKNEQTSVENIYAVGDILDGKPELAPAAIRAGTLLVERLFGGSKVAI